MPHTIEQTVTRRHDFVVARAADDGDGLTLEGYAAVFDSPTRIDSIFEGTFDEVIAPGAFRRTIDHKGPRGIRLQFDHGGHPLIGSLPIGTIDELSEDSRGLHVRARLGDNWLVEPFRDAIRDGAVDGMSFRFRVVSEEWTEPDDEGGVATRTLREVELFELGPVVWPAYDDTEVDVRARQAADLLNDPEQRRAVALALLSGTDEPPARQGTGHSHADQPDPASRHSGPTDAPTPERLLATINARRCAR